MQSLRLALQAQLVRLAPVVRQLRLVPLPLLVPLRQPVRLVPLLPLRRLVPLAQLVPPDLSLLSRLAHQCRHSRQPDLEVLADPEGLA